MCSETMLTCFLDAHYPSLHHRRLLHICVERQRSAELPDGFIFRIGTFRDVQRSAKRLSSREARGGEDGNEVLCERTEEGI